MTDSAGPAHPNGVTPPNRPPLAAKALDTTPENPWPVRLLSSKIADYIAKMPTVWVEGQVVQLNAHNSSSTAWITLRDTDVDMSLTVTAPKRSLPPNLREGANVVVQGRPEYWVKRGSLQLAARDIRPIGVGDLLARIEELKRLLASEGIFDATRKRPLPFLPGGIGLICAPQAKARDDVLVNARERWDVPFEIRNVAVQGPQCVTQVIQALAELDANPHVDVIIITRGGGSVEDLLPFSNEAMVRAVAQAQTPVVSAIGHESDAPLLDLVADYRASTPTDAAKRVVPDLAIETAALTSARDRITRSITHRISSEHERLTSLRSRPVLADPAGMIHTFTTQTIQLRERSSHALTGSLHAAEIELQGLAAAVRTLSPQATLDRGYAVLQTAEGTVVRSPEQTRPGDRLGARVAQGKIKVRVEHQDGDNTQPEVVGFNGE